MSAYYDCLLFNSMWPIGSLVLYGCLTDYTCSIAIVFPDGQACVCLQVLGYVPLDQVRPLQTFPAFGPSDWGGYP